MKPHHKLNVWQKAIELVVEVYRVTEHFPKEEIYGLINQMRRAAVSIASNIAEGAARGTKAEFKKFLAIAQGSAAELETQVIIAGRLSFPIETEKFLSELDEIIRRVETLFTLADKIEQEVAEAMKRTEALTQAVLAKAFRGELVEREVESNEVHPT